MSDKAASVKRQRQRQKRAALEHGMLIFAYSRSRRGFSGLLWAYSAAAYWASSSTWGLHREGWKGNGQVVGGSLDTAAIQSSSSTHKHRQSATEFHTCTHARPSSEQFSIRSSAKPCSRARSPHSLDFPSVPAIHNSASHLSSTTASAPSSFKPQGPSSGSL